MPKCLQEEARDAINKLIKVKVPGMEGITKKYFTKRMQVYAYPVTKTQ